MHTFAHWEFTMAIFRRATLRLPALVAIGAVSLAFAGCGGSNPSGTAAGLIPGTSGPSQLRAVANIEKASFTFTTLDDQNDPTFNQLLGINNHNKIAGYYGSGAPGHPNKGYTLVPPFGQGNYMNENYPGSAQTQVTGLNNIGDTCGFWVKKDGVNLGFVEWNGVFTTYKDPHTGTGTVNQILGINNSGIAVGFYTDGAGRNHGFTLNQATGVFTPVTPPGASNVVVTGINNNGDIVGFYGPTGAAVGFLRKGSSYSTFQFPGGSNTQPFGVNINDAIGGSYLDGAGVMHGFVLTHPLSHAAWQSIDDPNGVGSTVINGLNDSLDLVGFYTDAAGNTDGMLATP